MIAAIRFNEFMRMHVGSDLSIRLLPGSRGTGPSVQAFNPRARSGDTMMPWTRKLGLAIASGTVASVTSTLALGLLARSEVEGVRQPVNATQPLAEGLRF
jgi:hypothetical protein